MNAGSTVFHKHHDPPSGGRDAEMVALEVGFWKATSDITSGLALQLFLESHGASSKW